MSNSVVYGNISIEDSNGKDGKKKFHLYFQSVRDIQYAIQMTCCFTFGTLIGCQTLYGGNLNIQWVLPVLATLVCRFSNVYLVNVYCNL